MALVVGLPSLHDATAVPFREGDGRRLRAGLAECDEGIREDWPELERDRARVRAALDLPSAHDLLQSLHTAAADDRHRPVNDHGDRYRSMMGPAEEGDGSEVSAAATTRSVAPVVRSFSEVDEPIPGQLPLF